MRSPSYEPSHCIVCGHADAEVVADEEDMRREVEALWAFHEKRLRAGTPVNRLRDRVAFSQDPPWRLVACRECGLLYRNPAERAFEVQSIYERDSPARELLQALHDTQRASYKAQAERLAWYASDAASVLEVGSYVGAFLSAARDQELNAAGIDINPAVNAFTRSLGFSVQDGELHTADVKRVDAIAIWNTFDQLAEPRGAVLAAYERLRPQGVLAIRVPNGEFYRNERARGTPASTRVLAHNNLLTFPYRWGFTPKSLQWLLDSAGFQVVDVIGDVLVPVADEWTKVWARIEERLVKWRLRLRQFDEHRLPWFEIYATKQRAAS
jgi:SAM-dependent methyltransferase